MLDATFTDSACIDLHNAFECIADTFPEMTLRGDPRGITFEGMDNSHVALMIYSIPSESFAAKKFMCQRSTSIGLRSAGLRSIFKTIDKDTKSLTIRYDSIGSPHIIQILVEHNLSRVSEFSVLLSTLTPYIADTPQVFYSAEVRMPSFLLQRSCQDFRQFNDTIMLKVGLQKRGKDVVMDQENVAAFFSADAQEGDIRFEDSSDISQSGDDQTAALCASYKALMTEIEGPDGAFIEIGNEGDIGGGTYRFVADPSATLNGDSLTSRDLFTRLDRENEKSVALHTDPVVKDKRDGPLGNVCIAILEPIGSLRFSLRFLSAFSRAHRCSKEVLLSLKQNNPCRLQYNAGSTGDLVFYLAPNASS
ncbi:proliferating cell nuclear antigen PCNA [Perkinsela sp. CCAP 1560/4]|nr:proliferating cell nuclear antigen PCNA [Perkinsela sp. CCAP 1560/4]|eukprot:KNH07490.1 proliferating cell nuclear antigen PCNA [Perkinsela sp. CCAP 1560/4]